MKEKMTADRLVAWRERRHQIAADWDVPGATLKAVAAKWGISPHRVRQMHDSVLHEKLAHERGELSSKERTIARYRAAEERVTRTVVKERADK